MEKYSYLKESKLYKIVQQIMAEITETQVSVTDIMKKTKLYFDTVIKYVELIELIQAADRIRIDVSPKQYLISKATVKRP